MVNIGIHFVMDIMLKWHYVFQQVQINTKYHALIITFLYFKDSGTKVWFQEAIDNFSQELSFLKMEEEILKSHMKWFKYVS